MQIFYINDQYSKKQLEYYEKYYVELPIKGIAYTIKGINLFKDEYLLILNEIKNPNSWVIELNMPFPGYHYSRFTDVVENVLEWEKVDKMYKEQQAKK